MGWLISAGSSAVSGHFRGRSSSWWTGENSLWGQITGGGSDRSDSTGTTVTTPRDSSNMNPLILLVAGYLLFFN